MKLRLRAKVSLAFLAMIIGCMFALNMLCGLLLKPLFIWNSKLQMSDYGERVQVTMEQEPENIGELLESIHDSYLIWAAIVDESGQSVILPERAGFVIGKVSSERLAGLIRQYQEQEEDPYLVEHYNKDEELRRLYYIKRLSEEDYLVMSKSIKGVDQNMRIVSVFLMLSCLMIAVVGVAIWNLLTRGFTEQMEKMSRVTQNMAQLNFQEKINGKGTDEIGILAQSIDDLSSKLEKSITDMQMELARRKALVQNLAHEIKTPLTTIVGYTESIQLLGGKNQKIVQYCDIMLEECDALDLLAKEMMELSMLESSQGFYAKEILQTEVLFREAKERIQREMSAERIVIEYENELIQGNLYLLERVISNYLGNAVKYRKTDTTIYLRGQRSENRYVLSVTNEGESIPEKERELIWDVFYKTDKSRKRCKSYGIGLAVVRQIACIHGAEVGVRCGEGKNTFYFSIPILEQQGQV